VLVKFIPTKVEGTKIDVVLSYLFQKNDAEGKPREVVEQVAGTIPTLIKFTCDEIPSKNPYSHSVLTFSDEDMARTTEAQRLEILESYVDELAAGLGDKKRMPYLCVDHGNHFHILCLRYDLRSGSGKVYQPFVKARGDIQRFNAWKDWQNSIYGLDAPSKSGSLFRLSGKHAPDAVKGLLVLLNDVGADVVQERGEVEAQELVKALDSVIQDEGFEVARVTKSGFSVTSQEMKRNVRFRFTERAMGKPERVVSQDVVGLRERLACFREKLMVSMARYHEGGMADLKDGLDEGRSLLYGCHGISTKGGKWDLTF